MAEFRGSYDWLDVIRWQDEVSLNRGQIYDDNTGDFKFYFSPKDHDESLIMDFNHIFIHTSIHLSMGRNAL